MDVSLRDDPRGDADRDVLILARLARLLERACTDLDPPLTLAQYRLLAMIGDGNDRASQIAGRLALTKPTVSATVDTLVERGLVTRAVADDDRRALRLQLTVEGSAVLRTAEQAMRARLDDVLAHVDDRATVTRAIGAIGAGLDERRQERHSQRGATQDTPRDAVQGTP